MKPRKIISSCLQKQFWSRVHSKTYAIILIAFLVILFFPYTASAQLMRKSHVNFYAPDSLLISADLYVSHKLNPYIILLHQEKSCKAEFDSVAPRFIKMNYNCLAVDLRSGDNLGFYKNETAQRAREGGYYHSLMDAILDIEGAVNYLSQFGEENINLFGSASSASLALIYGRDNPKVRAVVAFSPGEYFSPEYEIKTVLNNYPKPVFIGCTPAEFEYLSDIEGFPEHDKVIFKPSTGKGLRGTAALLSENTSRDEYWLSLLIYFKSLH